MMCPPSTAGRDSVEPKLDFPTEILEQEETEATEKKSGKKFRSHPIQNTSTRARQRGAKALHQPRLVPI